MAHSKKKAALLTTASSLIVYAATALNSGNTIEASVLFVISAGLFVLYEYFQVDEIPLSEEDLKTAADVASETIEDRVDQYEENQK